MTFSLTATAEPSHSPPRVALTATEDDPDLSLQSCAFFRDGVPLRFEPAVTGDEAIAYDYDAPFDAALLYRADAVEVGSPIDWTEVWTDVAAWTGSGWAAAAGVASSTAPNSIIYRDASGTISSVSVTDPSNIGLYLVDASDVVVAFVRVWPNGTVLLSGSTATTVTGSGSFTLSLSDGAAAIVGTGWDASVTFSGVPTRVRLVAPPVATYVSKFGTFGTANDQFKSPAGVAVSATDNIWVADKGNNRIVKFDPDGAYLLHVGGTASGTGNLQFNAPCGIAVDPTTGNIAVADTGNNRVSVFDSAGAFLFKFGNATPTPSSANGKFDRPVDVAFDSTGDILVADYGNDRIERFDSAGAYVSKFGTLGSGNGELQSPSGLAIDSADNIWVADDGNQRIQKFDSAGAYLLKLGGTSSGSGDGQFHFLGGAFHAGIAVDSSDNVWVSDYGNTRLQKINAAGVYQDKYAVAGSGDGQLSLPSGLAIDAAGGILVADLGNNRVQEFTTDGGSTDDIAVRIALDPTDVTASDTETLTPTGATAGAWLTNAALPDLAILADHNAATDADYFIVRSTREETEVATNTVALEIEGSADVVTVSNGPRKRETWTLNIAATSETARATLLTALANDAPISLRFPATGYDGLTTGFYAVGTVTTSRIGHPAHDHVIILSLPLTPSRAPKFKPLWQWNWNTLAQTGMSWDDANAAFASWNDLLVGPT